MRAALRSVSSRVPEHVGLAYDTWFALSVDAQGRVDPKARDDWLDTIVRAPVPVDYDLAYDRWENSLLAGDAVVEQARQTSRLLVGHGNPSGSEVGLTVHHTWGTPIIPGSALKGLLASYVQIVYGPDEADTRVHPYSSDHADRERAPFQGVAWELDGGRIAHGPGEAFRRLFGAPDAPDDDDFGVGATRGELEFHDALWVPESVSPFARDIVTPHQGEYLRSGSQWPNEYEDPVPVSFLSVRPGSKFLFAITGPLGLARSAMKLLGDALTEWGVGGKTSSGYGRFAPFDGGFRARFAEAVQKRASAAAATRGPEARWRIVVAATAEETLLDWVRRFFQAKEDPTEILKARFPEIAPAAAEGERAALREVLVEAGYVAAWCKGGQRNEAEQATTGASKRKERGRILRDWIP